MSGVSEQDCQVVFVTKITTRSGKVIYAWQYGLKAFPIKVRQDRNN